MKNIKNIKITVLISIMLISIMLMALFLTACGDSGEEELSKRGYQIGTEVVDAAESFVNKDLDAETINNKIVPLSLDAEKEDMELYEYITAIIGDICDSDKEDDVQIEKDIQKLRDYIGYPEETQDTETGNQ